MVYKLELITIKPKYYTYYRPKVNFLQNEAKRQQTINQTLALPTLAIFPYICSHRCESCDHYLRPFSIILCGRCLPCCQYHFNAIYCYFVIKMDNTFCWHHYYYQYIWFSRLSISVLIATNSNNSNIIMINQLTAHKQINAKETKKTKNKSTNKLRVTRNTMVSKNIISFVSACKISSLLVPLLTPSIINFAITAVSFNCAIQALYIIHYL